MFSVHFSDQRFKKFEKDLSTEAEFLVQKLESGSIPTQKQFPKEAVFSFELHLVNSETLNKNIYAYEYPENFPHPQNDKTPLGEIYINPDLCAEQGHEPRAMLIHGFLHLLGYEHQTKNDTIAMELLEKKLQEQIQKII